MWSSVSDFSHEEDSSKPATSGKAQVLVSMFKDVLTVSKQACGRDDVIVVVGREYRVQYLQYLRSMLGMQKPLAGSLCGLKGSYTRTGSLSA